MNHQRTHDPLSAVPVRWMLVGTALALVCAMTSTARAAPGGAINYNRDIRPILSDNCFYCHGPDKNHRDGKFRLDERESAVKKEAIVPGKPDQSSLVERIFAEDADDLMPPPETHKKLSPAQKDLLKRWIAEGAEYQPHWAYIAPKRPAVPEASAKAWARNPIDAFVLQTLDANKLKPSPEADRRTLLRRLSLDLIGLPPTPAEVEAFVADPSPDAYEKQVDRLLASPRYGERMAVPWLDVVRYADTVGFHGDQNQNVFPYRDYVINAFNDNKPFDQFTVEQLAGDLLPNPTAEQFVATGFNRLNMMTREGGAQPKEYLAKYAADRVRTVGTTWLGSTLGCAECHDHKFDPIKAKDFYAMAAYFADVKQWGVYSDYGYTPNPDLKGWSNDHPFPPEIRVDSPYLQRRRAELERELADQIAVAGTNADPAKFQAWVTASKAFLAEHPDGWAGPKVKAPPATAPSTLPASGDAAAQEATATKAAREKAREKAPAKPKAAARTFAFEPGDTHVAAIRIEVLPGDRAVAKLNNGSQRGGIKPTFAVRPKKGADRKLSIYHADADAKEPRYSSTAELIGIKDGWRLPAARAGETQTSVWLLDPPVRMLAGDKLVVELGGDTTAATRVSWSPFAAFDPLRVGDEPFRAAALDPAAGKAAQDPAPRKLLTTAYLLGTAWNAEAFAAYKKLYPELLACRDGKAWTQVTVSAEPMVTRILPRGNWQDETGPVVEPAPPEFLPQPPASAGRASRLDLAKWIVSPENPLTARTVVNRTWKQFFGAGLSAMVDDLGAQGEWPSHPELLDWLAVDFRESGWDVKRSVRQMVTSAAYRQASNLRPELKDLDPANRLLSSQSPRRLEAEFVRDNALFAAGLLNLADVGGPSIKPYQPEGYYANLQFPDRPYVAEADARQHRRGVYVHWQRTFLHPMLANFDAPSREDCTGLRNVSNTPQQALTLLNDPTFVEAARAMATAAVAASADDAGRLDFAFGRTLGRPAKAKERESLSRFLAEQRTHFKATPEEAKKLAGAAALPVGGTVSLDDQAELAAWTGVCRVVLNLHETVTRY